MVNCSIAMKAASNLPLTLGRVDRNLLFEIKYMPGFRYVVKMQLAQHIVSQEDVHKSINFYNQYFNVSIRVANLYFYVRPHFPCPVNSRRMTVATGT